MSTKKSKIGGAALILLGLLFIVMAWGGHFQSGKVIHKGGQAVGEGSLVSPGMPAALSIFGLAAIFIGGFLLKGASPFKQKPIPATASPEDIRVLHLLEKIESKSLPIFFGAYHSNIVFSNGHFVELADSLPAAIDALRDLFAKELPEDSIRQVLPTLPDGKAEKVQTERMLSGTYHLSTPRHTGIVDAVYYDYLKMRYPRADVYCKGPKQPIAFYQDGILRAIVMPMRG